jgi:hypothetical protein
MPAVVTMRDLIVREVNIGEAMDRLAFELYRRATPPSISSAKARELYGWLPTAARRQWEEQALDTLKIALGLEAP